MIAQTNAATQAAPHGAADDAGTARAPATTEQVSVEGILAGVIGAAVIAAWFLILDVAWGRPLYTPSMLGTALFAAEPVATAPPGVVNLEMALMFTWVHGLAFAVIGGLAAQLLALAERQPAYGFGILLLFVVFEFGFVIVTAVFAQDVLRALTWPAVLLGNLLAAGAMTVFFWRRHPGLTILP